MKAKSLVIIYSLLLSSICYGENSLEDKIEVLDFNYEEIFGLSLLEICKLQGVSMSVNFSPVEAIVWNGNIEHLRALEQKGYLTIQDSSQETSEKLLGDIPVNKTDKHISLSQKGKELIKAFERQEVEQ